MVHPADEGSQIPEHPFDLGSELELPLLVDVRLVRDGPPVIDAVVQAAAVRVECCARFDELVEELASIPLPNGSAREEADRHFGGTDLLGHDERHALEVRLVHLHRTPENGFQLRQMDPELPKPEVHSLLVHVAELLGLLHRHLLRPAPQQRPEGAQVQPHVPKPRVGQEREVPAAGFAPVPFPYFPDVPGPTVGAEHVLPEDGAAQHFPDLRFGRNLSKGGDHDGQGRETKTP